MAVHRLGANEPAVNIASFALEPGGAIRSESLELALTRWRAGGGPYWIDLCGGLPEELAGWLGDLGLDPALLELLQLGSEETKILPLADLVYVAYPVAATKEGQKPDHFGLLCLDRLLITMHGEREGSPVLKEELATKVKLTEPTTAGVICALAIVHAMRLRHHVVTLRAQGDALADRMDSDPWAVPLGEILALKRRVLALGGVVDEELAVLEILRISNRPALPMRSLAETFQAAIEVTRATDRDIDRLDRRVSDLDERHQAAEQDRTNYRLGVLTVMSAIFMPLTLIAGIYGMNFETMPELHFRYGYPAVLAGMAVIAGALFWYFRTRWWRR
jgi:magnesium transporter